ncbi:MAG TPA: hypothetical protein VL400_12865, partial [Polyangiaceae bacterium]|nr:hypothetical protein [Polyangiaceae bacterium]
MSGTMLGGIVAMSVGGAALAGAGIAIGIRQSALSEVEAGCRDPENLTGCDPSVKDAESRGSTASTLFDVLVGVGGVGVGVGVALVVVDVTGAGDEPKKAALTVTASPRSGGGVISVGGAF